MKRIFFVCLLSLATNYIFSQTFMHGAGITIIGSTTGQGSNSDIGLGEGFTYFPRINFIETENLSVSAGIPLCAGISATTSYDVYGNSNGIGFVLNAPLIINLNFGRGSCPALSPLVEVHKPRRAHVRADTSTTESSTHAPTHCSVES